MVEIEFSVMESSDGEANHLLPLLEAFEKQYHIHVNLTGVSWYKGWSEIAKYGIYGHGPDVSTVGTSWIGSLAGMQTLRPFTATEVRALGGAEAFFEPIWQAGLLPNDPTIWATPWLGDVMVLYYWKNALEKAGIQDFDAAFKTDAALVATLKTLSENGYKQPYTAMTQPISMILHEAVHWVWNAGGNLISQDGKQVTFNQPEAIQGFKNYFGLLPYIPSKALTTYAGDLFSEEETPVHMAGPWLGITGRYMHPEWKERLGIAKLPGTAYVGGASFVIWNYSRKSEQAFELVRFLSSQPTNIPASPHAHELPTRRESLHMPSVETDVFHQVYLQALQSGRCFPTLRLWGSIEDKLIATTSKIWTELFADPHQDLDACLHKHLDPLAERLNVVLGS